MNNLFWKENITGVLFVSSLYIGTCKLANCYFINNIITMFESTDVVKILNKNFKIFAPLILNRSEKNFLLQIFLY